MAWSFDSSTVEGGEFSLIEVGRYNFMIVKAEEKLTKAGDIMISVQFKIVGGANDGRSVFSNFLVGHPTIGVDHQRKIKAICESAKYTKFNCVSELEGRCINAKIGHEFDKFREQNKEKIFDFKEFNYGMGLTAKSPGVPAAAAIPKKVPTATPVNDDDVPF